MMMRQPDWSRVMVTERRLPSDRLSPLEVRAAEPFSDALTLTELCDEPWPEALLVALAAEPWPESRTRLSTTLPSARYSVCRHSGAGEAAARTKVASMMESAAEAAPPFY
jgi:Tfp pilus assembly protein PilX